MTKKALNPYTWEAGTGNVFAWGKEIVRLID